MKVKEHLDYYFWRVQTYIANMNLMKKECNNCFKREQCDLIEGKPYCFSCGLEVLKK